MIETLSKFISDAISRASAGFRKEPEPKHLSYQVWMEMVAEDGYRNAWAEVAINNIIIDPPENKSEISI